MAKHNIRGDPKRGSSSCKATCFSLLRKFWKFFWEDDTFLSWAINIVVAFILIKWVIYPGLGLIFETQYPIVAVVSSSMEHDNNFEIWWDGQKVWYEKYGIIKDDFESFSFQNGFNRGDIMALRGVKNIKVGDVIVFWGGKKEPIIHRVVRVWEDENGYHYQTKGDHNSDSLQTYVDAAGLRVAKEAPGAIKVLDETDIMQEDVVGKAFFRIPYLGYIKIWFIDLLRLAHIVN